MFLKEKSKYGIKNQIRLKKIELSRIKGNKLKDIKENIKIINSLLISDNSFLEHLFLSVFDMLAMIFVWKVHLPLFANIIKISVTLVLAGWFFTEIDKNIEDFDKLIDNFKKEKTLLIEGRQIKSNKILDEIPKLEQELLNLEKPVIKEETKEVEKPFYEDGKIDDNTVDTIVRIATKLFKESLLTEEQTIYFKNKYKELITYYLKSKKEFKDNRNDKMSATLLTLNSIEMIKGEVLKKATDIDLEIIETSKRNQGIYSDMEDLSIAEYILDNTESKVLYKHR